MNTCPKPNGGRTISYRISSMSYIIGCGQLHGKATKSLMLTHFNHQGPPGNGRVYIIIAKGDSPMEIVLIYVGSSFGNWIVRERDHRADAKFRDCRELGFVTFLENASTEAIRHCELE
uniref:Uncharacterized protein n=1 Tax=Ditylenchus dipsaci TaxID=166011 RepID=A0A915DR55_9BILA